MMKEFGSTGEIQEGWVRVLVFCDLKAMLATVTGLLPCVEPRSFRLSDC